MDTVPSDSGFGAAEEDQGASSEACCLMRVGETSGWLHLFDNTEIKIGRGLDVTYQLLSPSCPLMISRLHCIFKQTENGRWTVTDNKSLNGVSVNGQRIPIKSAKHLKFGDTVQFGVPVDGNKHYEFEYVLTQRPLKDIQPYLAKVHGENANTAVIIKRTKRKFSTDEVEPSTSSKTKVFRHTSSDKLHTQPCPLGEHQQRPRTSQSEETGPSARIQGVEPPAGAGWCDLDNLQTYSRNILMLRERVDDTQRQVSTLQVPTQHDPQKEEQIRELQNQLETLRAKMLGMETLEKSFSETKKQQEKTQQEDERLKKLLDDALQEQKKVMEELALSRKGFEEVLSAKNKELEVSKEENQKARAQKDEVVTQVTEVLENELQCIICSELFIEAVILNCAHSFCLHCIKEWRKRKDECPVCRQAISSQNRCLALDNCIDSMVDNLSLEMKARRQTLITQRKANPAEVMVIHDDDSSSGDSSGDISGDSYSEGSMVSIDWVPADSSAPSDDLSPLNSRYSVTSSELEDDW